MIRRVLNHPILYTLAGTIFSVLVSYGVTEAVLSAAETTFPPIAIYLAVGLPAVMAPVTMYPLLVMLNRQRQLRLELERMVLTDVLTELPNRRAFFEVAPAMLAGPVAADAPLTAMMIDVDHFKRINDSYGHDVGDMVLKRVAGVIRDEVATAAEKRQWMVARIGGEEFAVLVDQLAPSAVARLAERICAQVHRWVGAGDNLEPATVSIGVAFRAPGMSIDKLLKAADDAVYAAKTAGRDRWAFAGDIKPGTRRRAMRPFPEPANDRLVAS